MSIRPGGSGVERCCPAGTRKDARRAAYAQRVRTLRRGRDGPCAKEYAVVVGEIQRSGSGARSESSGAAPSEPSGAAPRRGPVASTSCLVTVLLAAFTALVVLPVSLWLLGIACGGS